MEGVFPVLHSGGEVISTYTAVERILSAFCYMGDLVSILHISGEVISGLHRSGKDFFCLPLNLFSVIPSRNRGGFIWHTVLSDLHSCGEGFICFPAKWEIWFQSYTSAGRL